jgi:hypothetical protein
MRNLKIAGVVALAGVAAACGLVAPRMTPYAYPRYGFTADFPAPPKLSDTTDPGTGVRVIVLDAQSPGRDFAVSVTDVDPKRDIDSLVDDASAAMAKGVGGEVTYRTYCATAEGALGRELVIAKNGRRAVRARYYSAGGRFYILTAESALGMNPVAESTDTDPTIGSGDDADPVVKDFLISFHLTPPARS